MTGHECVAITGERSGLKMTLADTLKEMLVQTHQAARDADTDEEHSEAAAFCDAMQDLVEDILNYSEDSMGLGRVYYWPSMTWADDFEATE